MVAFHPVDAVCRFAFQRANPVPDLIELLGERTRIRTAQLQLQRKQLRVRQQAAVRPVALHLRAQLFRRSPTHPARAALSARYSSMVRLRTMEIRPSWLCTNPTLEMNGSMMWIFCSGVTTSSCRSSRPNRSSPYRADSSDPRPNASSITTNRKDRVRGVPPSSPNWYARLAPSTV